MFVCQADGRYSIFPLDIFAIFMTELLQCMGAAGEALKQRHPARATLSAPL